jgi:hypothetical protein
MPLSDVMGHAGLAGYAEVALIVFLVAFVAIVVRLGRASRADLERARRLPLEHDGAAGPQDRSES